MFFARRVLRIFPIYYLLIFGLFYIDFRNTRELFPWLITYSTNIYQAFEVAHLDRFNHFWSLAVEEQFYLFWPFVIVYIKPSLTLKVIIFSILLGIGVKAYMYFYLENWLAASILPICCLHSLGMGALLAYLTIYRPHIIDKIYKQWIFYVVLVLFIVELYFQKVYGLKWFKVNVNNLHFSILAALIILKASKNGYTGFVKLILEHPFVVYGGKISYGMYIYHFFMIILYKQIAPMLDFSTKNDFVFVGILFISTYLLSDLSWRIIESPINSLKSKVPYLAKSEKD
ncbi:MAG: acyltransferase [Flavobacteriales bacterium]|nr:acyltransferase [Flavobacteriales bacterium]